MKNILKTLMICVVLVLCFSSFLISAETNEKEWSKMTGPATFYISENGCTMEALDGVSFFKYAKEKIDIRDFSCTFSMEQENWFDGYEGDHQYYYNITLSDKAAFSGSQGLFLLLMPQSSGSLRVEGQILHTGYLLSPTYVEFDVDTLSDLVMHGKVLHGKGEGGADQYEITFENSKEKYVFDIPENYQFHKANDGLAYFSFGAGANGEDNQKMTIKKVNNIVMTGSGKDVSSGTEISENASAVTTQPQQTDTVSRNNASLSNETIIAFIIAISVLFVVIIAGFIILILTINKKFKGINGN